MKILSCLLLAVTLLVSSLAAEAANLSLIPSQLNIVIGSALNLDLVLSDLNDHPAQSVGAFDVDVAFDEAKLSLVGISFGNALGDENSGEAVSGSSILNAGSVNLFQLSWLEANASTCVFCLAPFLEDIQGNSIRLATLRFNASQFGAADFGLTINSFSDGYGESLTPTLNVTPSVQISAVPVPSAIWLFGFGLSFLGFARRKIQ